MIFFIKEVLSSILRAKLSFIISLVSSSISILLILAAVILLNSAEIIDTKLKDKINFSVFLKENVSSSAAGKLKNELEQKPYTKSVIYISKAEAEKRFIQETGEDFKDILDINPLPASFELSFNPAYVQEDSLSDIKNMLSGLNEVDEIAFQNSYVYQLLRYISNLKYYILGSSIIVFIISLYIVYSVNRLIIQMKMPQIETMKLVGAKLSAIKVPIYLSGLMTGLISSLISIVLYYLIIAALKKYIFISVYSLLDSPFYYGVIIIAGPLIGIAGSFLSAKGINLNVKFGVKN
ncbi:MAG TPA: permease-like cell division protein FtsX [Ignavibacteriales bacterium]|nr:permease-like cell division protein FtsX [Ignavibacteriales bacterium]